MSDLKWKIAYVCPRYIPRSAGGAEVLIQSWAERMQKRGHYSEVLTTCARDHFTWKNEFPPGEEIIEGVTVRRFPVNPRDPRRHLHYQNKIISSQKLSREEEEEWISGGVNSDDLCRHIQAHRDEFDCFIFAPYLFGVTYFGVKSAPGKSILVPCLHDEPYAYLKIIRDLFSQSAGIFFNSRPEAELARWLMELEGEKTAIVGLGIESSSSSDPEAFRQKYGIDFPYLLYSGRREGGKNTPLLIEYTRLFKRHRNTELKLLLMGTGEVALNRKDAKSIRDLGYISEEDKWNGYAASLALCQPSTNESLSIVLLESWLAGRPGLVNAFCPVTVDHCLRSQGGLYFRDYYEFEECLLYLLEHPGEASQLGKNGQEYVRQNFSWEKVLDRLENGISKIITS